MTNFVYIHGFNSAYNPDSDKVKNLQTLGKVWGVTYDSFAPYDDILSSLKTLFSTMDLPEDVVFVGTSLGAFWATECAKAFGAPSVIINPCHSPKEMLQKYIDIEHINYLTGQKQTLTQESVNSYNDRKIHEELTGYWYYPLLILDMGDEVIDSKRTISLMKSFRKVIFQGGSHRFDHMEQSLSEIKRYVNFCEHADILA